MLVGTLVVILNADGDKILLGRKHKGAKIGADTLNCAGGDKLPQESIERCAWRETREEFNIDLHLRYLRPVAIITFYVGDRPDYRVFCFRAGSYHGTPQETREMSPEWHEVSNMPYDQMLEADRYFFPQLLEGRRFIANVYYRERAKGFERIEFLPFDPTPFLRE